MQAFGGRGVVAATAEELQVRAGVPSHACIYVCGGGRGSERWCVLLPILADLQTPTQNRRCSRRCVRRGCRGELLPLLRQHQLLPILLQLLYVPLLLPLPLLLLPPLLRWLRQPPSCRRRRRRWRLWRHVDVSVGSRLQQQRGLDGHPSYNSAPSLLITISVAPPPPKKNPKPPKNPQNPPPHPCSSPTHPLTPTVSV